MAMEGKGRRGREVGKLRVIGRDGVLRVCREGSEEAKGEAQARGEETEGREVMIAAV